MKPKSKNIETNKSENNGIEEIIENYQNEFQLSKLQQVILTAMLEYPELTQKKIANKLKIGYQWISELVNRDNFKKAFAESHKEAREILLKAKTKAALKYIKLINAKKDSDSIKVCEGILGKELEEKSSDNKPIEITIKYE